jgi:hypothetical protein
MGVIPFYSAKHLGHPHHLQAAGVHASLDIAELRVAMVEVIRDRNIVANVTDFVDFSSLPF